MAAQDAVKAMVEKLFDTMDLKSGNTYDKNGYTVCMLRFLNQSGSESEPKSFIQKHPYHVKRDRERSDNFKQEINKKRSRKQTQFYNSGKEELRSGENQNEAFSETGMSPCSVYSVTELTSPHTDSFRISASPDAESIKSAHDASQGAPHLRHQSSSDISETHSESDSQIYDEHQAVPPVELDQISVDTQTVDEDFELAVEVLPFNTKQTQTTQYNKFDADIWIPEIVDTVLFRNHCDQVNWLYPEMRCYACRSNVRECLEFKHKRRMAYCDDCEQYFCENCVRKDNTCFCDKTFDDSSWITKFLPGT